MNSIDEGPRSYPAAPVGPFTSKDGTPVWIAEKVLGLSVHQECTYKDGNATPTGRALTYLKTASLSCHYLSEPIDEVRQRLGWETDKKYGGK